MCSKSDMKTGRLDSLFYCIFIGMSEDNKTKAFRECYGHLHELRSLAPNGKMIALTATATKLTKETILIILLMEKPFKV